MLWHFGGGEKFFSSPLISTVPGFCAIRVVSQRLSSVTCHKSQESTLNSQRLNQDNINQSWCGFSSINPWNTKAPTPSSASQTSRKRNWCLLKTSQGKTAALKLTPPLCSQVVGVLLCCVGEGFERCCAAASRVVLRIHHRDPTTHFTAMVHAARARRGDSTSDLHARPATRLLCASKVAEAITLSPSPSHHLTPTLLEAFISHVHSRHLHRAS